MEILPVFSRSRVTAVAAVELNAKLMRASDSKVELVTVNDPKTWWIREPLIPSTMTLYVPIAAVALVKIFIEVLAVPPEVRNTTAGEVENVTPGGTDGRMPSDMDTSPVNPPMLVTVMLIEPAEFWVRVRLVGLMLMLKLGAVVGDIVRNRAVV
jgi:hypothetical protein